MTSTPGIIHVPVLAEEVLRALEPKDGAVYVDGTFGNGGYSRAVLDAADCTVYAIDRDPDAIARGQVMAAEAGGRLILIEGRFSEIDRLVAAHGVAQVSGIALDIGISSFQIDDPARGFSFAADGPLDMRMERSGATAADIVNSLSETELAELIYRFGEERQSRRIAAAIVSARAVEAITRTGQLADIIIRAIGRRPDKKTHVATKTFQALRIYVNDELGELRLGLEAAERLLATDGTLCVVSFHSLEDKLVKSFLAERSGSLPTPSRHRPPQRRSTPPPTFFLPKRGAVKPGRDEIAANPRSRSARLRVAVRTDAAPWPETRAGASA